MKFSLFRAVAANWAEANYVSADHYIADPHSSIAEDASGKDLCFHVVTVLCRSTTSGPARCTTVREQPIIHNGKRHNPPSKLLLLARPPPSHSPPYLD
jgi:hypothetical protein